MRTVQVTSEKDAASLGTRIELAESGYTRMRGLLGRASLNEDEGLWILPSSGVHTFGMAFAIDVIGLDKKYKVVKLWPELKPGRMTALHFRVRSVLELPAGTIARSGIEVGDRLNIDVAVEGSQAA